MERLGRIDKKQGTTLKNELNNEDSSQYFADFGVFLAMKPTGYVFRFCALPLLLQYDMISFEMAGILFVFFSIIARTIYAVFRFLEDAIFHKKFPIVSVLIAPIFTLGTLAYPCQMAHDARKGHMISQFIIYEVFSTVIKKIPFWGGYNSEWEYRFNRWAFHFIKFAS